MIIITVKSYLITITHLQGSMCCFKHFGLVDQHRGSFSFSHSLTWSLWWWWWCWYLIIWFTLIFSFTAMITTIIEHITVKEMWKQQYPARAKFLVCLFEGGGCWMEGKGYEKARWLFFRTTNTETEIWSFTPTLLTHKLSLRSHLHFSAATLLRSRRLRRRSSSFVGS